MIKTIIIEDEVNVREALKKMLHIIEPTIKIIAETAFVSDAVNLIKTLKPELVFLDIKLEDGTGFDILKNLDKFNFKIIFTTAYNQYAIKAFKYSAVDYLLKPIDPNELQEAIQKAIQNIKNKKEHQELLQVLQENNTNKPNKIVLKTTEQYHIISINNIIRLEANGAYTNFITTDEKIIVSKNLKFYQDILNTSKFIRSHQSHLINTAFIKAIKNKNIIMSNHDIIPIATRKQSAIIKILTEQNKNNV